MDIGVASRSLFSKKLDLRGLCNGEVVFSGNMDDPIPSLTGQGRFKVREGQLIALPFAQAIVTKPWNIFSKDPRISNVQCLFSIEDQLFKIEEFPHLRMYAENGSEVAAKGSMSFDRWVELKVRARGTYLGKLVEKFFETEIRGPVEDLK